MLQMRAYLPDMLEASSVQGLANIRDELHQILPGSMHRGEVKDDLSGVFGGPANGGQE